MSILYAKIRLRGNKEKNRKVLQTDEQLYNNSASIIVESVPYNPQSVLEDGMWYYIINFSRSKFTIDVLTKNLDSVNYDRLEREEYEQLDFIFSPSEDGNELYFQRITKVAMVRKRRIIEWGGEFKFCPAGPSLVIEECPDAIYIKNRDTLYFRDISSIKKIFPDIEELYRVATSEEITTFLNMDFISTVEITAEQVNIPNRKRIAMALGDLQRMDEPQRKIILKYVAEYCPDLASRDNKFIVKDNKDLASLLYGIEQRYYTTLVGGEKRLANSVIRLP